MSASSHLRPTTIADVAARAGVSPATVSRVMNGNTSVDSSLANKVRAAADHLNYSASPLARSLVLGRTGTVAVVVPDFGNPTFHGVLRGLSRAAASDGYHVLVADSAESIDDERLLAAETRRRCDGLVLCAPRMPDSDLRQLVAELDPIVLVNRELIGSTVSTIAADYRSGLSDLLALLHGDGHRRLAYLAGAPQSASNARRLAAVHGFLGQHPDTTIDVLQCGVNFAEGYDAVERVLASGATGVLAFNDLVAMGLLSALRERGVDVPGQLSLVGFDDIPFARYTTPSLTTASVPVAELGAQAWQRMWGLLNQRGRGHTMLFRPRIERRDSTGPVPVTVG